MLTAGRGSVDYLGAAVGEIGFLRGIWADGSRRLAWLEDYAAARLDGADTPAPRLAGESASSTCRSRIRAPRGWCSTT